MPEFREREPFKEQGDWKSYTVGVMSASSKENEYAIANAYAIGQILAEKGYNTVNGGYGVGGMGALRDGFVEACRVKGVSEQEIPAHLTGVVYSPEVIGHELAKKRTIIKSAQIIEKNSLAERAGGIINRSDAVVVVEGGLGTALEFMLTAQDEWFRQLKKQEGKGRPKIRPIIIIDSKDMMVDMVRVAEERSPGTIGTFAEDVFILAGHKTSDGELANLQNDPQVKKEFEMIVDYYYLINKDRHTLSVEEKQRINEVQSVVWSGRHRFKTLKDAIKETHH